jgi:hypothetical protein
MHARLGLGVAAVVALVASDAVADPKPTAVDIKPFRDQLIVLQDAQGGTYAVLPPGGDARVFYGNGKTLYEQVVVTRSSNGETGQWDVGLWAPRVPNVQPGIVQHKADGTWHRYCGDEDLELTQRTGDKAKQILDKSAFMTSAMVRIPRFLARDDAGIYYYVDEIRKAYGGKGYRVFVGKKGAMKEMPLTDVALDAAGDVFATKTGDLRLVKDAGAREATWVRGEKQTKLHTLDTDVSSPLIFSELGVYTFIGTICENL